MNSDAIEAMRRESEKLHLSELRIRVEAARDRADNADVASKAAVELAEQMRRQVETLNEVLEEQERHMADYREEIAALRARYDAAQAVAIDLAEEVRRGHRAANAPAEITKLHRELESYEREIMEWIAIVFQLREAAQYVLAQHGYESPSLAALGKLLAGEERRP